MKGKLCVIAIIVVALFSCQSQKTPELYFPEGLVYPGDIPKLTAMADEGYLLYKKHCGMCHGITKKGKDNIPDFTQEEMDTYMAQIDYKKSKHEQVQGVSKTDLQKIFVFLDYRKKE